MPEHKTSEESSTISVDTETNTPFLLTLKSLLRLIAMHCADGGLPTAREYQNFVNNCFSYAYQLGLSWHSRDIAAMAEAFWWTPDVAAELGALGGHIGKGHLHITHGDRLGLKSAAHLVECADSTKWWGHFPSKSEDPNPVEHLPCHFSERGLLDGADKRLY